MDMYCDACGDAFEDEDGYYEISGYYYCSRGCAEEAAEAVEHFHKRDIIKVAAQTESEREAAQSGGR